LYLTDIKKGVVTIYLWNKDICIENDQGENITDALKAVLLNNSFSVASHNEFYMNYANSEEICICQWLYTLEEGNEKFTMKPFLSRKTELYFPESGPLTDETVKSGWSFIDVPYKGVRGKNRMERLCSYLKKQFIYAMAYIYSNKTEDKLLVINNSHNPIPMRVWVNGKIVFAGYANNLVRREECIVTLQEGGNIILVERSMIPQNKMKDMFMDTGFSMIFRSLTYFLPIRKDNDLLDGNMICSIADSVRFIQQKCIYEDNEIIQFYLLPKKPEDDRKSETYEVCVQDSQMKVLYSASILLCEVCTIKLSSHPKGVLKIQISKGNREVISEYILFGTVSNYLNEMTNKQQISQIQELTDILDMSKGGVRGTIYPIDSNVYHYVFKNLYELEKSPNTITPYRKDVERDGKDETESNYHIETVMTHNQGSVQSYGVYVPKGFDRDRWYPLVIQYAACYGRYPIPGLNGEFAGSCFKNALYEDVIVLVIPCIYDKFILYDELVFLDIYKKVIAEYKILPGKISLVGFCGSAGPCMQLLYHYPHLFSSAALIAPYINDELLERKLILNIKDMPIYFILNPAKGLFLPELYYLSIFKNADIYICNGFEHEEVFTYFMSESLIKALTKAQKPEFCEQVDFTADIPISTQKDWVKIMKTYNNSAPAAVTVKAEWGDDTDSLKDKSEHKKKICIISENVKALQLLIDRRQLNLDNRVELWVNGRVKKIVVEEYMQLEIMLTGSNWIYQWIPIERERFYDRYYDCTINIRDLGIKSIYTKPCVIVTNLDKSQQNCQDEERLNKEILDDIFILLQMQNTSQASIKIVDGSKKHEINGQLNVIHVFQTDMIPQNTKEDIKAAFGINIEESGIMDNKTWYKGDVFIILLGKSGHELYIVYSTTEALIELKSLLMGFCESRLLYENQILWNNGKYVESDRTTIYRKG